MIAVGKVITLASLSLLGLSALAVTLLCVILNSCGESIDRMLFTIIQVGLFAAAVGGIIWLLGIRRSRASEGKGTDAEE